jgi:colicin import membrane protein
MSEVTDLIAAIAAIAKDPKAWEKRLGDADDIAKQLAEARKAKKEAEDAAKAAAADLETARYERGQAERATRDAAAQSAANHQRERELRGQEAALLQRKNAFEQEAANSKVNFDSREADLDVRERLAAKKLNDAQKLMASYDEAKHKAALQLAS